MMFEKVMIGEELMLRMQEAKPQSPERNLESRGCEKPPITQRKAAESRNSAPRVGFCHFSGKQFFQSSKATLPKPFKENKDVSSVFCHPEITPSKLWVSIKTKL